MSMVQGTVRAHRYKEGTNKILIDRKDGTSFGFNLHGPEGIYNKGDQFLSTWDSVDMVGTMKVYERLQPTEADTTHVTLDDKPTKPLPQSVKPTYSDLVSHYLLARILAYHEGESPDDIMVTAYKHAAVMYNAK